MIHPKKLYLTSGVGTHKEDKNARDDASRKAGIGKLNMVNVSSIIPPGVKILTKEEFEAEVNPGDIVFAVNGLLQSDVPGQRLCVGLAYIIPRDPSKTGYFTEIYEHPGINPKVMKRRVETMALQLLAEELKVDGFVADDVWVEGQTEYKVGDVVADLKSIIREGEANLDGDYTCVLVAAILLP